MSGVCPMCSSPRCGNHAACARQHQDDIVTLRGAALKVVHEVERREGRQLSLEERLEVVKLFVEHLNAEETKS